MSKRHDGGLTIKEQTDRHLLKRFSLKIKWLTEIIWASEWRKVRTTLWIAISAIRIDRNKKLSDYTNQAYHQSFRKKKNYCETYFALIIIKLTLILNNFNCKEKSMKLFSANNHIYSYIYILYSSLYINQFLDRGCNRHHTYQTAGPKGL